MFDYPLLEALYAVEKAGDFESVARSHGVTKSAISQSLRLLEERMGAATVCRETTRPTYFGSQLCRHLEHVKLLENKFLSDNANFYKNVEQSSVAVSVAVHDDILSSWFQDAIIKTRRLFKDFYLDIEISREEMTSENLRSGKCLAAITTRSDPLDGFDCFRLGRHHYHATASPEFFKRHFSNGFSRESLENATLLKSDELDGLSDKWSIAVIGSKIQPSINTHTLRSSHGIVEACINSKAWAITSALQVTAHIEAGNLVELIPGQILVEDLYWHINQCVSSPLSDLTDAVLASASSSLCQSNTGS